MIEKLLRRIWRRNVDGAVFLGKYIETRYPIGLETNGGIISGDGFYLDAEKFYEHIFIQGTVGRGKTEFLKTLMYNLIQKGMRVCLVDGAGSPKFAEEVCAMAHDMGLPPTPVLKYGWAGDPQSSVFNGFIGSDRSVCDRFIELLGLPEVGTGGVDYYLTRKRIILLMICGQATGIYSTEKPITAPRSFHELLERVNYEFLADAYGDSTIDSIFSGSNAKRHIEDLRHDALERAMAIGHLVSTSGFRLGEAPVTIFSINQSAGGSTAKRLFSFLAECFKDAMGQDRNTVWVIDEVGAFNSREVAQLAKIGRQNRLGIVMGLQTPVSLAEGFGGDVYSKEILDTTNTKIIFNSNDSTGLRGYAGTRKVRESRTNYDENHHLKGESVGRREVDKIAHDDVTRLAKGESFVILGSSAVVKMYTPMVEARTPYHPSMEDRRYLPKPKSDSDQPPPPSNDNPEKTPF